MNAKYIITEYRSKDYGFLFEDERLVKIFPVSDSSEVDSIYTAKVVSIVPSINVAFLNVGLDDYYYYSLTENDDKNIFLYHGSSKKVAAGDELLVQISREPYDNKKGVATANITLKGDYAILNMTGQIGISKSVHDIDVRDRLKKVAQDCLQSFDDSIFSTKPGVIIRTAAENAEAEEVGADIYKLLEKMADIFRHAKNLVAGSKVSGHEPEYLYDIKSKALKGVYDKLEVITDISSVYNLLKLIIPEGVYPEMVKLYEPKDISLERLYGIGSKLEKAFSRSIYLKSGGNIVVEPTEALTVVDVNSGKAVKGRGAEETFLKINKEAASEIARILRLRNLSGIIIIDFINMKKESSVRELIEYLKSEINRDEVKVTYVDMTPLGLVEITRKKVVSPISLKNL